VTQQADVFGSASILLSIVMSHYPFQEIGERIGRAERPLMFCNAISGFVPGFVSQLIQLGLSTDPDGRLSFHEIIEILKKNDFRIAQKVDSEAVSEFGRSVESSQL
jgi:hypothetical protein